MVDYTGLENRHTATYRGFESLSLRFYGCSSVGRALVSKTRCREFEPYHPCIFGVLVQLVRISPCHGGGHGFEPRTHRTSLLDVGIFSKQFFAEVVKLVDTLL